MDEREPVTTRKGQRHERDVEVLSRETRERSGHRGRDLRNVAVVGEDASGKLGFVNTSVTAI